MKRLSYEYIKEQIENEGYILLTDKANYKNTKTKLNIICPDGTPWETTYNKFYLGSRKPCVPLSYEYVKEYIEKEGYDLLSESYKNNRTKLILKCRKCGNIFKVHFNNFKDCQSRCPQCYNKSKGEEEVKKYLDANKIIYIRQYRFDDCKFKNKLPFDFYLPKQNICIEYNGSQHYGKSFKMTDEEFEAQKKRDLIKKEYCRRNKINLIIIPYWEFKNINEILNNKINKESTSTTMPLDVEIRQ